MRFRPALLFALFLGSALLFTVPTTVQAQPAGRMWRIGWLSAGSPSKSLSLDAFQQGLSDLGYVEGHNITIEYQVAEGRHERLPELATEQVRLKVDVIVAASTPVVRAAKAATRTIPIVMVEVADPVRFGFVHSLARPGGNITGLSNVLFDLGAKQLALLREVAPGASRVAVLVNPDNPAHARWRNLRESSRPLGIEVEPIEARTVEDFVRVSAAAESKHRPDALLVFGDLLFSIHRARMVEVIAKSRIPAIYVTREYVAAGGLFSYGPSSPEQYRRAAYYVDRILKGAKPADLPNMKTAKALGLTIPPSLLLRADHVIE